MKKKIGMTIAATLAALSVFAFSACNVTSGNNAYDIAVENGYQGTLAEWLKSLEGVDGKDGKDLDIEDVYNSAVKYGYEGTFLEFLKEYLSVDVQEDNDVKQIAQNITSVVSVVANFEKTVKGGSIFGGSRTETVQYSAAGSGVIVQFDRTEGDAYVVTNYHVVYDSESNTKTGISNAIYLYMYGALGADAIESTFVAGSMDYDIAILRVEDSMELKGSIATAAEFGDSNTAALGEKVFVIGNPGGDGISVTSGVLSVDSEYIEMESSDGLRTVEYRVMRTDAAINPGNSGGALFNAEGKLIGITNAKSTETDVDNVAYALPITQVKYVMQNAFENGGAVKRAMLGITVATTDTSLQFGQDGEIVVVEELTVYETPTVGSAAYGQLKAGDILKNATIDGVTTELSRRFYLIDLLLQVRLNDTIKLTIERDGTEKEVEIKFDKESYFTLYK
ncbi:MAG: serine protease [Clostridia bacterium]|nr:serine protease [Clostridia bacterium]